MAGAGYRITDLGEINSMAGAWESTAGEIEAIKFTPETGALPPHTSQAISRIGGVVEKFMSASAERVREMATEARQSAAAYDAVEVAVVTDFTRLGL